MIAYPPSLIAGDFKWRYGQFTITNNFARQAMLAADRDRVAIIVSVLAAFNCRIFADTAYSGTGGISLATMTTPLVLSHQELGGLVGDSWSYQPTNTITGTFYTIEVIYQPLRKR